MIRGFIFLTGFGIAVAGGISTLAYLNLIATGASVIDFLLFILTRPECYLLPIGILLVAASLYMLRNDHPIFRDKDKKH